MLEPDVAGMLRCFSPAEHREVGDFLGIKFPASDESASCVERSTALVNERRWALCNHSGDESLLYRNLRHLQQALDLNETELDLIAFPAMLRLHPGFEALAGKYIGLCADFVFHRKLAQSFDVQEHNVSSALAASGTLVRNGLVIVREGALGPLENRLRLLRGLISALMAKADSPAELLRLMLPPTREAHLPLSSYPHLAQEIALLSGHLRKSLATRSVGANALFYGPPGTGKTELAAALAASLGCPLYVSEPAPYDGGSLTPRDRMRELIQLQRLVRVTQGGIVLIDEAEDLFPTLWSDSEKVPSKATVNECLDANPTPTIWISNRTQGMDEAFLRRFDMVIHVPPLPASVKRKLLRESLPPGVLEEHELRCFAARRELSPAMITRMARVAATGDAANPGDTRENLRVLSSHYLRTLGTNPLPSTDAAELLQFDPALLNTDPPLDKALNAMAASRFGARMLLHGPPGTGKTALGRALAEKLDKPLLQRQASSLLSMWVGGTERNLRDMFDEARCEGGVLLLDEADSFLRSRDNARTCWEVTQTNELLTQMEAYEGVFLCTTNRLEDLDPAALRRFDFKVTFNPLRLEQRIRLIDQCRAALDLADAGEEPDWHIHALRLDGLTPGDAAAALRRLRLSGRAPTTGILIDALADECRYRPDPSRPIGFVH